MAISRSDMERQLRNMGGIMSLQEPRQGYFLGKIVKKAKRAVKKVVKSPIGKAAILAGLTFGVPGTSFGGLAGKGGLGSFFGKGSFNPLKALITKGPQTGMFGTSGLGRLLGKFGLAEGTKLTGLGKIAGIGALSGLGGLMAARGQEEEDDEQDILDRGEGLDIDRIVRLARMNDPQFRFLPPAEFTGAYAKGGEVDAGAPEIKVKGDVRPENMKMARSNMMNKRRDAFMAAFDAAIDRYMSINDVDVVPRNIQESIFKSLQRKMLGRAEGGIAGAYAKGGEVNLEKDPEYKGWKKIYMMSPDAAESHPKHTEFENYLKSKENKKAEGGIMNLGGMEMDLRGGGFVPLGAKEKADDVPARLSKNEFVMTADAVRAAGGGSVDKGADKMYKMMKNLEAQV